MKTIANAVSANSGYTVSSNLSLVASAVIPWDDIDRYTPGLVSQVRAMCNSFALPPLGKTYVHMAVSTPSRRVVSTTKSMSGAYPSAKMGVSIAFESRTLELPFAITCEHDANVIGFFDQPPAVKVCYIRDGRTRSYTQTPDYLVLRDSGFVLIECKPVEQISLRNSKDPGFYLLEGSRWVCPPLQAAAGQLGMRHEVWTEEQFTPNRLRNLRMLGDFVSPKCKVAGYDAALLCMREFLGLQVKSTVAALLQALKAQVCVDHLYAALGRGDLAFDYDEAPLSHLDKCYVFRDQETCRSWLAINTCRVPQVSRIKGAIIEVAHDTTIRWNRIEWVCMNPSPSSVTLRRDEVFETLPRASFDKLLDAGTIEVVRAPTSGSTDDDEVWKRVAGASTNELRTGNLRLARIRRYLSPRGPAPASRTERRYVADYRIAEERYGNGFIGLLPGFSKSGNRTPRLAVEVITVVVELVNQHYLNCKNANKKAVYGLIADRCGEEGLPTPSYAWLCRFIDKMPAYVVALKRKGRRGAYPLEPKQDPGRNVDTAQPERPFEKAHVDHTLIDLETICGETSQGLGRLWLTVLIDQDSRVCLAHYLTFDPPSYRSILMVLRNCVRRHGRLPEILVCDGGKDMSSVWFETACALYSITILRRPVSKGRFGSTIERMFGTINTNFLHQLIGNTQLTKNVRQMSEEVDPSNHAVWTLPELDKKVSQYLYEVYEQLEHRELLVTPRFQLAKGMEMHGERAHRRIPYNDLFLITTSPSTPKGKAKVTREGVKIHYLWFYHPTLQRHLGKSIEIRYDPFDSSIAWGYVGGTWLQLRSRHQALLQKYTERDLQLATTEWKRRRSSVEKARISEPILVKFLKEILETETLLIERRRSAEERRLREATAGGADAHHFEEEEEDGTLVMPFDEPPTDDSDSDEAGSVDDAAASAPPRRPRSPASARSNSFADIGDAFDKVETA